MAEHNISVTTEKRGEDNAIETTITLPDTVEGCVKAYGEPLVMAMFNRAAILQFQANLRARMKKAEADGKTYTKADAAKYAAEWVPSMRAPGKTDKEKAVELLGKLSPEARAELLKDAAASLR